VNVVGKGLATMNVNPAVTFQLTASALSPQSSGTGGIKNKYIFHSFHNFRFSSLLFIKFN
jgi:hypothetical protein